MQQQPILSADTLLDAYNEEPQTPDILTKSILKGALVNKAGFKISWPDLSTLTMGALLNLRIIRDKWNDGKPVSVRYALGVLLARRAQQVLQRQGAFPWAGYSTKVEQALEFRELANRVFRPLKDVPVSSMLCFVTDDDTGFFQWSLPTSLNALEQAVVLEQTPLPDAQGFERLVYRKPVGDLELSVWRARFANPDITEESVFGAVCVLTDRGQNLAAYLLARVVFLPQDFSENEVMWSLGAYDSVGLELGHSLRSQLVAESIKHDDLLDGQGLIQLFAMEVREDLRVQGRQKGIGAKLLKESVPLICAGLTEPVSKMAAALQPFQYAYPIDPRLPAPFVLAALDAADALREYLDNVRPQDLVDEMRGTEVIYLATDPRARGSAAEQEALCEAVANGED